MKKYEFPSDFIWGVSTAAAQIEGAAFEDGKGASIWDVFSRIPGKIRNNDSLAVSCDSYHLYKEDIARMKSLGIKSYRFSFSWARILPDGIGRVNEAGIAYYKKLIACLKKNGIVPNATLYHWDLPYALQVRGGFGNRDIVKWFCEYTKVLFDAFGDDIDFWATFNEPIATYVGYAAGFFAPGIRDEKYARQCIHNLLLCHGEAVKLFRTYQFKKAKIGIVVDVWKHYPARPDNADDVALATKNNETDGYSIFLHPLFLGGYSKELTEYLNENDLYPQTQTEDFEIIHQELDFYGLNFYNGLYDNAEEFKKMKEIMDAGGNYQNKPESHLEAIEDVLHMLKEKYHVNIPIYITENGLPQVDEEDGDMSEFLDDQERIDYTTEVLIHLQKAIGEGIDVRGYYMWSLMDNFEWNGGFAMRYGLYYTNYETLERIPKKSAGWYKEVIANNGLTVE